MMLLFSSPAYLLCANQILFCPPMLFGKKAKHNSHASSLAISLVHNRRDTFGCRVSPRALAKLLPREELFVGFHDDNLLKPLLLKS